MCSSVRVKDAFRTFSDWNCAWHQAFQRHSTNWKDSDMYTNGQFDEIPYIEWDENALIDEFYYHDELVAYNNNVKEN